MAYEHEVFPWLKNLGEDGQREFFEEILTISVHSAELGTPIPEYVERVNACVAAWKSTAEAWADPEIREALTAPTGGDFGEVPRPEAEDGPCCLELSCCGHTPANPASDPPRREVDLPEVTLDEVREARRALQRRARSLDEFPHPRNGSDHV